MLLIVLGVAEFGRAIHTFNTLSKGVRDAVRHLSQFGPGDSTVQAEARCLAVHGRADCGGPALAPGLTTGQVVICDAVACPATHANQATGRGVVNLATVTIEGVGESALDQAVQRLAAEPGLLRVRWISLDEG
jgi:Flp pilus assembly protein TadG